MSICKYCHAPFNWGLCDGKWVTLIPVGDDALYEKAYQDEGGHFRAAHRLVCTRGGGGAVSVTKLARPIPPTVDPNTGEIT